MQGRVVFLVARLIPSVLSLVVAALLTRLLKPEEYGLYALGLSIIFFLTIGVFEWLGLSLMRMAAGASRPDLLYGTIMTCFITLLGVCVIVAGLALMLGGLGDPASLVLASLFASSVTVWFELRQRAQMAELRAVEYFRMSVGRGLLTTLLVSAAAFAWRSASLSLFALAVSNFLAGLLVPERHLVFSRLRFDRKIFASVLRFGVPLSVSVETRHCFDVTRQMAVAGVVRPRGSRPVQRRCFGNPGADPGSGGQHRALLPIHWPYERWSLIPKRRMRSWRRISLS